MYGSDKKFIAEVNKVVSTVVEEILKHLQALSGSNEVCVQSLHRFK